METNLGVNEWKYLKKRWGEKASVISPLGLINFGAGEDIFSKDPEIAFIESGWLKDKDNLTVEGEKILKILTQTQAYVHIHYQGLQQPVDIMILDAGSKGRETASISMAGTTISIKYPAPVYEIVQFLQECTGSSLLKGIDFIVSLPEEEAFLLGICLDLGLQAKWLEKGKGVRGFPFILTPQLVEAAVREELLATRFPISNALITLQKKKIEWSANRIEQGLRRLADKELFKPASHDYSKFVLDEKTEHLILRLSNLGTRLDLNTVWLGEKNNLDPAILYRAEAIYLQSGVFDMLRIEQEGEQVNLKGIAPIQLFDDIEISLRCCMPGLFAKSPSFTRREIKIEPPPMPKKSQVPASPPLADKRQEAQPPPMPS